MTDQTDLVIGAPYQWLNTKEDRVETSDVDGISEVAFMTMMRRDYYTEPQSVVIKPVFFHDTIDGFPVYSSLAGSLGNIAL